MGVEFDASRVARAVERTRDELSRQIPSALTIHALYFEREWKASTFTGYAGRGQEDSGRSQLYNRSGRLRGSFKYSVSGEGLAAGLSLTVGSGIPGNYARIQEYGGTIRPIRGRYLTVPLPDNQTATGNPRYESAARLREGGNTFVTRTKAGNLLIGLKNGDGPPLWLWKLVESVTIKPRLGFRDFANRDRTRQQLADEVRESARISFQRGFGRASA